MSEPIKPAATSSGKAGAYIKIAVAGLIILSDVSRLAQHSLGAALGQTRSGPELFGYALATFLLGVVLPIWLLTSAIRTLRGSAK